MPTTKLSIEGMSCGHCVSAVKQALESVPGVSVKDVRVGSATIETAAAPGPVEAIKAAIEDAGYFAEVAPA
jgi:copper chaperone CopZ